MAKNKVITHLVCATCKNKNYTQKLTKKRSVGSLNIKKFCAKCRKHEMHKEIK